MQKLISCGIPYLDKIMGGFFLGDNVVWVQTPGTSFDVFLDAFLKKQEDPPFKIIYVSFDFPPQKILNRYEKIFKPEEFILVDAFTFGKGKNDEYFESFYNDEASRQRQFRVCCIKDTHEPGEFIRTMGELQEEFKTGLPCKYFFGSLTGMQELWGERDTLHFFTYTCPKLFEFKALAYWPLVREAHSKAFLATIGHITQIVFSLTFEEGNPCGVRLLKLDGRPSNLLNITHYYNTHDGTIDFLDPSEHTGIVPAHRIPKQAHLDAFHNFSETKDSIRIGGTIRDFRLAKNLSQVDLAQKLNITPSALSQIENNQSLPSLTLFIQIARFFGKPLDAFFSSEQKKMERKKKIINNH